jgi:hypothetical protein
MAALQADVDQNESDADASFSAATTDRALIRTQYAAADSALSTALSAEIDSDVAAQEVLALAARNAIQADVDQNESDADAAIAALQADVDQNESDADTAIAAVASDLSSYETSNDAALAVETGRLDALLSGSGVDLDQLVELVAAYELADTTIISSITTLQADVDQNESDADTAIAAVASDLSSYETSNDAALAAEIASTNTDFASATTDRTAIRTEFAAADSTLEGYILEFYSQDTIVTGDSPYTMGSEQILFIDASGGNVTLNLPAPSGDNDGAMFRIKRVDGDEDNSATVASAASIEGGSSISLNCKAAVQVVSDGSAWWII